MSNVNNPTMGGQSTSSSSGSGGQTAQMQEKMQDIKQNLSELGSGARQMAQDQYSQLRSSATDYIEQGRTRAMDFEQSLESQIRDQPLRSVMMAAGIGLVLGVLWSRR